MMNYEAMDRWLVQQRREFEMTIKLFGKDMDMKFNNMLERGNEIIKTLNVMSADMKMILSDLQCMKRMLK